MDGASASAIAPDGLLSASVSADMEDGTAAAGGVLWAIDLTTGATTGVGITAPAPDTGPDIVPAGSTTAIVVRTFTTGARTWLETPT